MIINLIFCFCTLWIYLIHNAADLALIVQYGSNKQSIHYAIYNFILILLNSIIIQLFSLHWFRNDGRYERKKRFLTLIHGFQIGFIFRLIKLNVLCVRICQQKLILNSDKFKSKLKSIFRWKDKIWKKSRNDNNNRNTNSNTIHKPNSIVSSFNSSSFGNEKIYIDWEKLAYLEAQFELAKDDLILLLNFGAFIRIIPTSIIQLYAIFLNIHNFTWSGKWPPFIFIGSNGSYNIYRYAIISLACGLIYVIWALSNYICNSYHKDNYNGGNQNELIFACNKNILGTKNAQNVIPKRMTTFNSLPTAFSVTNSSPYSNTTDKNLSSTGLSSYTFTPSGLFTTVTTSETQSSSLGEKSMLQKMPLHTTHKVDKLKKSNRIHVLSFTLQLIWRMSIILSRILALTLFTTIFEAWIIVYMGLHWLLMTLWITVQKTRFSESNAGEEILFRCVMGWIYTFCFYTVKGRGDRTRGKLLTHHIFLAAQNMAIFTAAYYIVIHHPVFYTLDIWKLKPKRLHYPASYIYSRESSNTKGLNMTNQNLNHTSRIKDINNASLTNLFTTSQHHYNVALKEYLLSNLIVWISGTFILGWICMLIYYTRYHHRCGKAAFIDHIRDDLMQMLRSSLRDKSSYNKGSFDLISAGENVENKKQKMIHQNNTPHFIGMKRINSSLRSSFKGSFNNCHPQKKHLSSATTKQNNRFNESYFYEIGSISRSLISHRYQQRLNQPISTEQSQILNPLKLYQLQETGDGTMIIGDKERGFKFKSVHTDSSSIMFGTIQRKNLEIKHDSTNFHFSSNKLKTPGNIEVLSKKLIYSSNQSKTTVNNNKKCMKESELIKNQREHKIITAKGFMGGRKRISINLRLPASLVKSIQAKKIIRTTYNQNCTDNEITKNCQYQNGITTTLSNNKTTNNFYASKIPFDLKKQKQIMSPYNYNNHNGEIKNVNNMSKTLNTPQNFHNSTVLETIHEVSSLTSSSNSNSKNSSKNDSSKNLLSSPHEKSVVNLIKVPNQTVKERSTCKRYILESPAKILHKVRKISYSLTPVKKSNNNLITIDNSQYNIVKTRL